jgi:uncharacterized protein with HEPN domain
MTPRDSDSIRGILVCIEHVRAYVARGGPEWAIDEMAIDAIAKRLEEIGELAKRLSPEALTGLPGVDWRGIKGMREVLAHDYLHAQITIIEAVVDEDLDVLETELRRTLDG